MRRPVRISGQGILISVFDSGITEFDEKIRMGITMRIEIF